MSDTNYRIRFMANNLAALTVNDFSFSSEIPGFEAVNALDNFRSSTWKPAGYFEILAGSNDKLYINDGSNKTITVTAGGYISAAALGTQIATQLNAVSSGWGVDYDTIPGTFMFRFTRSSPGTIRLSQTTNAIWNTLGFTSAIDQTGLILNANEQRNHTFEFFNFDFGYQATISFLGMIGAVSSVFGISSTGIITLEGNNINDFTMPPFSKTATVTDRGVFTFNISDTDASYRFWRLRIRDIYNPVGPQMEIGGIYMGDFQTLQGRNISTGFVDKLIDPSTASESEAGVIYFDKRTKYTSLNGLNLRYLENDDRLIIKDLFNTVGKTDPFYVSLDPLSTLNDDITEFTKFVIFMDEPQFTNVGANRFSTTLNLREMI